MACRLSGYGHAWLINGAASATTGNSLPGREASCCGGAQLPSRSPMQQASRDFTPTRTPTALSAMPTAAARSAASAPFLPLPSATTLVSLQGNRLATNDLRRASCRACAFWQERDVQGVVGTGDPPLQL